ncbi:MAG TPA: PD-(D/E)XK nuclease family protein [Nitrospirae bacterium]|nr:PD-(D/E)XK nuclease family protein [Nitrospirota bacterium]
MTSAHFPGIPEIVRQRAVSLSSKAGIVKGKNAWLSIRETLLNSSREKLSLDDKKILNEFQKQITRIITALEKLKQEGSLIFRIEELETILNGFNFFNYPEFTDIPANVEKIISEFRRFVLLYSPDKTSFPDFVFYFKQMLRGLKGSDKKTDGVRVVPFENAAGLEQKILFFGGLIENDLPSRPPIDPILPEQVKKALGLPHLEYYLNRQKRHFERLINTASTDPYLSCPSADGDKVFLPSPYLDWEQSLSPCIPNIPTREDISLRDGAFKQRDFSDELWNGELPSDKDIERILVKRFGPKAFFRVTDIDAYRKCPMRFYIERFLGLEMAKTPEFEVESRLWGKLAHSTMENLFRDGDVDPEGIADKLLKALDTSLKEFPVGGFWAGVAKEIFLKLLPALIEQESEIRRQGFNPIMTEKSLKAEVNNLRLKGKIDRIDWKRGKSKRPGVCSNRANTRIGMDERGSTKDEGKDQVRLLDYKTGSTDRDSLQLPLYVSMWNKGHDEIVEKAGFYSLKDGKVDWYPKRAGMEEFLNNALLIAEELVEKMRKGLFAPVPFKASECGFCSHSALCRGTK